MIYRWVESEERPQNKSSDEKKKPEIQIQMSKLDKISGVMWDTTSYGIMILPRTKLNVPMDDLQIHLH